MMCNRRIQCVGVVAVLALLVGSLAAPASAGSGKETRGVTSDEITFVVLAPDIDAVRARGFPSRGTVDAFVKKFQAYVDEFGPIRGRKVVLKKVVWDPLDATSFDRACTQAVADNEPFAVLNAAGYRPEQFPCITVERDTPLISGDFVSQAVHKTSGKNLLTLGLPSDVTGRAAAAFLDQHRLISKNAKIGLLSNNAPTIKAALDAAEKEFKKRGYEIASKVEVNGLAADSALSLRESAAAANTMKAAGVDTVLTGNAFGVTGSFYQEAGRTGWQPKLFATDGQADLCTYTAPRLAPKEAVDLGLTCVTSNDGKAALSGGIRPDTKFEQGCRETSDAYLNEKSVPHVPSGGVVLGGVEYTQDMAVWECTMMNFLLPAIKAAGRNPTWSKVYDGIISTTAGGGDAAYRSNGNGHFAKDKPYFADQLHAMKLMGANASTPKDANGVTFNGCPLPLNCYVPQTIDGKEWFAVDEVTKG